MPTRRQTEMRKALRALAPWAPFEDAEAILAHAGRPDMRALSPGAAVWLSMVSHVRHRYTDYDRLLAEDYPREAARHFVIEPTNKKLSAWGGTRLLSPDADEEDEPSA